MDLQGDIKWTQNELNNVKDPMLVEALKNLLQYRKRIHESDYETSDEQKAILDQRLADHEANPNNERSWTDVKSDVRSKYGV